MNFKPDEKNIRSLLKSGCQFVIPRFQREYSWDKKNYQEFFEDMINNLVASSGVINDDQYFLGTMLFVGNFAEKPDKPIEVVDGQQRLTTITILFSVLSDRFRELGEDTLSKQLFNYITTRMTMVKKYAFYKAKAVILILYTIFKTAKNKFRQCQARRKKIVYKKHMNSFCNKQLKIR